MYSKELEELIESVLADGVVTDQERTVLRKRAQACGEDPDEVMIVVDGRLAKMKKASAPTTPTVEKRGNIVKCPSCGAPIEAGSVKCAECGYVFTNVKTNNSAERFAKELAVLIDKHKDAYSDTKKSDRNRAIREFIMSFPVPTGKEDMLEFLASLDAKRRNNSDFQNAYESKYNECVTKAKVQFAGDAQIEALLNVTKISAGKKIINWLYKHKIAVIVAVVVVFFVKSCVLDTSWFTESPAEQQWKEVTEAMNNNNAQEVVAKIGSANPYSVEDHQGEITSYVRRLVREGNIDAAEDVVSAANAHSGGLHKIYVAEPLYDYFVEQGNTVKAERYKKVSSKDDISSKIEEASSKIEEIESEYDDD